MDINWYPGHMAKAKRLLADQLSRVDVVVELCDARLPYSSRNPDLDKLLAGKKRVLLLNKADLADPAATSAWLNYFRAQGIDAAPYSASTGKAKDALAVIDRAAKEAVERAAQKGIRKTVKAMVVGVPNVGKSTFTNKLHGGNIAKTGDRPGVTRADRSAYGHTGPGCALRPTSICWIRPVCSGRGWMTSLPHAACAISARSRMTWWIWRC